VDACHKKCDFTVVSVFVNPTQFNNPEDFSGYPRCMEEDVEMLRTHGTDVVFAPDEKEMYPEPDTRKFYFGEMEQVMEGAFRPGHFNGVGQVVSKLFEYCMPDAAFFGEKDFQQLAIIRELARQLYDTVQIVACPTVRENDGLAMSSRNRRLSPEMRKRVPVIAKTLFEAKEKMQHKSVAALKEWALEKIGNTEGLEPEYVEIVNAQTLQTVEDWNDAEHIQMCVAVWAFPVRLIDNIALK
jgi:pantoate--beta-alanine ligase